MTTSHRWTAGPDDSLRVLRSTEVHNRSGQAVVCVGKRHGQALKATHVLVYPTHEPASRQAQPALASLQTHRNLADADVAQVDQVIRNAIGVEVGESVRLEPVRVRRWRWPDRLFGHPTYVTTRVQAADATTVERDVCLLDELTLNLLGITSGDAVVMEGRPRDGHTVAQVRVKALKASDAILHRRESLHGGDLSTRFPS